MARAERFIRLSGVRFNSTVGGALIGAGYDRPFEPGSGASRAASEAVGPATPFAAIAIDPHRRSVTLPPACRSTSAGLSRGGPSTRQCACCHLFTGTDSGAPWLRTLYLAAVLLVGMLTVVRLLGHTGPTERRTAARTEA